MSFQKDILIPLDPNNAESIRAALVRYQHHLNDGSAFQNNMLSILNIEFVAEQAGTQRRLQVADIKQAEAKAFFLTALKLDPQGGGDFQSEDISVEDYVSESLIFAIALQFPELEKTLEETAQAMVNYARYHNDSDAMWSDECSLFGCSALYILARYKLDYVTYLAQFMIPYWDQDHSYGVLFQDLLQRHGWNTALIKAYLWCDNDNVRFEFYCGDLYSMQDPIYQPLGDYLKQHPEQYDTFKTLLTERLLSEPKLAYHLEDHDSSTDPVVDFYLTLLPLAGYLDDEDDKAEHLAQHFLHDTLENEAFALQKQIEQQTEKPLFRYAQKQLEDKAKEEKEAAEGYDETPTNHSASDKAEQGAQAERETVESEQPEEQQVQADHKRLLQRFCSPYSLSRVHGAFLSDCRQFFAQHPNTLFDMSWQSERLKAGHIAYAAFLLKEYGEQNVPLAETLMAFFQQTNTWEWIAELILEENYYPDEVDETTLNQQLEDYFVAKHPALSEPQALALMQKYARPLDVSGGKDAGYIYSPHQQDYHFLKDNDGDVQRILLACGWLLNSPYQANLPQAQRLWSMLVHLAPVRVASLVLRQYSQQEQSLSFTDPLTEVEAYEWLESMGIEEKYLLAYQVSQLDPEKDPEAYQTWLDLYAEIDQSGSGMIAAMDKKRAANLAQGLNYIAERKKHAFYYFLSKAYPRFHMGTVDCLQEDFQTLLERTLKYNLASWLTALSESFHHQTLPVRKINSKPVKIAEDMVIDPRFTATGMEWVNHWFVQDMGDHQEVFAGPCNLELKKARLVDHQADFILFTQDANRQSVLQEARSLLDPKQRFMTLYQALNRYLQGEESFDAVLTLFSKELDQADFKMSGSYHTLSGLDNFIWLMPEEQRDRLVRLLTSFSYRGFKLFEYYQNYGLVNRQFDLGELSITELLASSLTYAEDEKSFIHWLFAWLKSLEVRPEHLLTFCLKHHDFAVCQQHLKDLNESGELDNLSQQLTTKNRQRLNSMLSQAHTTDSPMAAEDQMTWWKKLQRLFHKAQQ